MNTTLNEREVKYAVDVLDLIRDIPEELQKDFKSYLEGVRKGLDYVFAVEQKAVDKSMLLPSKDKQAV